MNVVRPQNLNYLNTDEICECFTWNDEANKKCKLIVVLFNELFLCIISASTGYSYVEYVRYYLRISSC